MPFLQRIWSEIKKGENFDLYLTVIAAITLASLNIFGIGQSLTAPITLAVLALLAISLLGSRHQNEDLVQKLSQTAESLFVEEFPPSLKSDFLSAKELWLVGIALTTPANVYYSVMEEKLRKGHSIKILVLHPIAKLLKCQKCVPILKGM